MRLDTERQAHRAYAGEQAGDDGEQADAEIVADPQLEIAGEKILHREKEYIAGDVAADADPDALPQDQARDDGVAGADQLQGRNLAYLVRREAIDREGDDRGGGQHQDDREEQQREPQAGDVAQDILDLVVLGDGLEMLP